MISLIIISIFNWWSGRPHARIHCLHGMVLGWFWSSITHFTKRALFIRETKMQVSYERVAGIQYILTLTYIPQPWLCNKIDRIWHILLWACHSHFIQHHVLHWYLTCIFISAFSLYLCWYGLRYQCYGPHCYQMTKGNTGLSPYLWSTT